VSLRGLGPSGVSRTLVLLDGVPFNDPFGGWVYWTRIPLESVNQIEVIDGSSSSLYGNFAMGGVVNIVTKRPVRRTLELKAQYGNRNSPKVDVFGSDVRGKLGASIEASLFNTGGFPIVADGERGPVDTKATVDFRNVNVKVDYQPTNWLNASLRIGHFRESRDNGKVSTIDGTPEDNDTTWNSGSGSVRMRTPDGSDLQATLFADFETFRSTFLAVPAVTPPRSLGRMTLRQTVRPTGVGGMVQWTKLVAGRQLLTAGTDWRWLDGDSNEAGLDPTTGLTVVLERVSGGTQRSVGAFVQDMFTPTPRLSVTLSARADYWRNYNAHNLETNVPSGVPTANHNPALPSRSDTVVSPRAAAMFHVTDRISAWTAVGSGFRSPTLNELYRQFRVGTVLTLANHQLGPERLRGVEAGVNIVPADNLTWRTTWFHNRIRNPVANVTLSTSGVNVIQQRQNLGRTRVRGIQTNVDYRLGARWSISGGYLYDRATVEEFDVNPTLVGKSLPQVPKHRGSIWVAYSDPAGSTIAAGVQYIGVQYDDDQNLRVVPGYSEPGLPKYAVVDLTVSHAINRKLEVFVGAQNLFNRTYYVGTFPTTIGSPRLVSGGVRLRISGN
jgi:outer membrane receptor protein involved in Fe transport